MKIKNILYILTVLLTMPASLVAMAAPWSRDLLTANKVSQEVQEYINKSDFTEAEKKIQELERMDNTNYDGNRRVLRTIIETCKEQLQAAQSAKDLSNDPKELYDQAIDALEKNNTILALAIYAKLIRLAQGNPNEVEFREHANDLLRRISYRHSQRGGE